MKKSNCRFEILNNCPENWWKDEGGKRNTINVTIKFNNNYLKINIPLILSLYFENKEKVNDQNILIITNYKGEDIKKKNIEYKYENNLNGQEIKFRINKVSRRFDNKKFILKIEVDKSNCSSSYFGIKPIYTNPIFVQSKRKIPACERDNESYYNRKIKKKKYIESEIEYKNRQEDFVKELRNEIKIIRKLNIELKNKISKLTKKVNENSKKKEINYIYNFYGDTPIDQNLYKYSINDNSENEYDSHSHLIPLGSLLHKKKNKNNSKLNLINLGDINPLFIKK